MSSPFSRSQSTVRSSSVAPDTQQLVGEPSVYLSTISKCWPRYRNFLNEYSHRSSNYGPFYYDAYYKRQPTYFNPIRTYHYEFGYY
ncbi:unnamed protein product [Bursaphelenchus okinawaensis]|uniref:Uncharacterized protein n=1 Tax=Bursaphelenchus okinawaensis TaxID=465554 RepID=A0A811KJB1_9BILA|nr:unnamed protein product [Bursaphelenchus okinawaensis]CAG9104404.1 unnamed protein product [Bursaphelenchus okinawaensis]